ncbi:diacylglycerol/lipid kinase family protein [Halalkalibacter urbisdiaboli]|uniref:diacylglycerol/lipid kinase family protein n=1 Tax=Halalkalibacter urbisdiaboli TaxID=1960589 RepID=UPI000B436E13|nr:diacylglycerol kinase family protein [Halalkalibacter urbisdiaboli]
MVATEIERKVAMYGFIVNPYSGNGKALKKWTMIEMILQEQDIAYQVVISHKKDDVSIFIEQIKNTLENIKAVVVLGGDGTLHEVVNHLAGTSLPFKVIPTGSGNDFARSRGISKNVRKELESLLTSEKQWSDLMKIGNRYCLTVIGLGFDGMVAKVTNEMKLKRWFGRLSYVLSVLKVLHSYKPSTLKVTLNENQKVVENVWLIAVANHPYYGGGMKICPEASSEDGKLDVCIVHGLSKLKLLLLFPRVFNGSHVAKDGVEYHQVDSIKVDSDEPLFIHGDGEMIGKTPAQISIQRQGCYILS